MMQSVKAFFKNLKIQNKIFLFFSMMILLLSVIIGSFSYIYASNIILKKTLVQSEETIEQLSQNIDHNITLINEKLSYLTYNPLVQKQLKVDGRNMTLAESNSARREMSKFMVQVYHSAILDDIQIYGDYAQEYYICSRDQRIQYDQSEEYIQLARAANGQNIIINDDQTKGIQIVKKITDVVTLESLGVLRASLKRSVIQKTIDQIDFASDGSIMVLDGDGKFVVGDSSFAAPELLSRIIDRSGTFEYRTNNMVYQVVYMKSTYTYWNTIGILPQSALRHELLPLQTSTFFVTLMFLLLGLVLARILSDIIARPLGGMVTALGTLSIGDFSVRLPEDRQDEIGHLRAGFNQMIVKIETLVDDVYRKEVLKKESEFKALQAQINPHFLYNTLDTINWMARKRGMEEICNMVSSISNLMRISISNKQDFITVKDELQYVRDYLYIQKTRYRNRIIFEISVDEKMLEQSIPKLILQPIVENAIIHGAEPVKRQTEILLMGYLENDVMVFKIRDTGKGIAPVVLEKILDGQEFFKETDNHTRLGVHAVHQRIRYLYGPNFGMTIDSVENEWTCVTIRIPFKTNEYMQLKGLGQ